MVTLFFRLSVGCPTKPAVVGTLTPSEQRSARACRMNLPETRPSLLIRFRNHRDVLAWEEFAGIYEPLIRRYVARRGIQDADVADVTQEVLLSVMRAIQSFDPSPERGKFRGWLYRVVSNATYDLIGRQRRQPQRSEAMSDEIVLSELAAGGVDRDEFDVEYERRIFDWACERIRREVRESTWRAFWMTGVAGRSGQPASELLGLSVGAVYIAKSRVMARIKAVIEDAESTG